MVCNMARIAVLLSVFALLLAAAPKDAFVAGNTTTHAETNVSLEDRAALEALMQRIAAIDVLLARDNIWHKVYGNYQTYLDLEHELELNTKSLAQEKRRGKSANKKTVTWLEMKIQQLNQQISLMQEYQNNPFSTMIKPKPIPEEPQVGNPIAIIGAFSFIKMLSEQKDEYQARFDELAGLMLQLEKKSSLIKQALKSDPENETLLKEYSQTSEEWRKLFQIKELAKTAMLVYNKRVDEVSLRITSKIKEQAKKGAVIGIVLLFLFLVAFLLKWVVKRTITDNERFYMANKIINFGYVTLLILILLFAYIENVTYLVTVLGFASAGIAIAMKDWFMSMLGWLVIVIGGAIHVGDRIKVVKEGIAYVGDVMDISLFRMTILEDITLTTYVENRRAGRIIFVPNNFIFTNMIANYSHSSLKTVWDGIDFTITFYSNHKKAAQIAKDTAKKYSKGYTDITRNHLNRLRSKYSLKNTNVEPRVYTFMEEYGLRVSVWYLTNAFATLTLRSTISSEILEQIKKQDDIAIAYPSQQLYMDRGRRKPTLPEDAQRPLV